MGVYRVCLEPGCPRLCRGSSRCDEHTKAKRQARSKTPQQQMYKGVGERGRAWRKVRAEYIRSHPICEWHEGCLAPVEHVHHIDGDPLGPHGLDPEWLQGLCRPHHSRTTSQEQPGGWHRGGGRPGSPDPLGRLVARWTVRQSSSSGFPGSVEADSDG